MSIQQWFVAAHLPPDLQQVSLAFAQLATRLAEDCSESPQCAVALQKLLEAKDAAVRATIECRQKASVPSVIQPREG